jgi:hypothetical protein
VYKQLFVMHAMNAASWWQSEPDTCGAKRIALFGLAIGLVVYWVLAFVLWQPEGRGRRGWKARIVQKARNALQERLRAREGGRERETTRMSSSPEARRTPARSKRSPDGRSDRARRKPSLEGKPRAAARRSPEGISHDAARSRPEDISLDAARSRAQGEPRASWRRSLKTEPLRSDEQRAQRMPEPYPSAEIASALRHAASARGERGDSGHRSAVKDPLAGARRRLVRHEVVPNTTEQANVTKRGEPAQTSPHSRSFQTLESLRRHNSAPVPPVAVGHASRAFAQARSGRMAVHDPFDQRLRLMPGDDDNEVAFTVRRLHMDWHMNGRHNRSAPSIFLVPDSEGRAREVLCSQGTRCSPLRLSKGAAIGVWTLPRSASFASGRMMLPVVPDWHLWFQDVLRSTRSATRATGVPAKRRA